MYVLTPYTCTIIKYCYYHYYYYDNYKLSETKIMSGNSIVTVKNSVRESDFSSWTDAANSCFGNSYLPTNYSNSLLVDKDGGSQLWTGCFKTRVTYEYNGKVSGNHSFSAHVFVLLMSDY